MTQTLSTPLLHNPAGCLNFQLLNLIIISMLRPQQLLNTNSLSSMTAESSTPQLLPHTSGPSTTANYPMEGIILLTLMKAYQLLLLHTNSLSNKPAGGLNF